MIPARPDFLFDFTVTLGECEPVGQTGFNQTEPVFNPDFNRSVNRGFVVNRLESTKWDYPCGFESFEMKRFILKMI